MTYDELQQNLSGSLVVLSSAMIAQLKQYAVLLKEWNAKINLTAIDDEPAVIEKHYLDSLLPAKVFDMRGKAIADLGSGAGFPGIPLAIAFPDAKISLVEATGKKVIFLNAVIAELKLQNVVVLQTRAEDLKKRESFDVVTARGLAKLPIILELGFPLLKVGGVFIAMKSTQGETEIVSSAGAIKRLSGKLVQTQRDSLPECKEMRLNFFIEKRDKTSPSFPRRWDQIEKKPL